MNMTTITGKFATREVWLDGIKLSPKKSQKLRNHSPDGFNWGYGGSGPAQLALAIMLTVLQPEYATQVYQIFKWEVLAKLPEGDFEIQVSLGDFLRDKI